MAMVSGSFAELLKPGLKQAYFQTYMTLISDAILQLIAPGIHSLVKKYSPDCFKVMTYWTFDTDMLMVRMRYKYKHDLVIAIPRELIHDKSWHIIFEKQLKSFFGDSSEYYVDAYTCEVKKLDNFPVITLLKEDMRLRFYDFGDCLIPVGIEKIL